MFEYYVRTKRYPMEASNRRSLKNKRGKPRTLEEKFWLYVHVVPNACWKWTGHTDENGYPRLAPPRNRCARLAGETRTSPVKASRISWEIHNGLILTGLCVLHKCDNPECTNPEHLFLGTQTDNMRDMATKDRACKHKGRKFDSEGNVICKYGHRKILIPGQTNKYVCRECQKLFHVNKKLSRKLF